MQFIFKHFGKFWVLAFIFWVLAFIISILISVGTLGVMVWAVIKLVTHFTAVTPAVTAVINTVNYLS